MWSPKLLACAAGVAIIAAASGCQTTPPARPVATAPAIDARRELWITDVSVVDNARARGTGPWSFGGLMRAMAPTPADAGRFTKEWLATYQLRTPVNGFPMDSRPGVETRLIRPWMARDGATDFDSWNPNFANAPFRLLGIVYRPDLVKFEGEAVTSAGEARFVFEALDGPPEDPQSEPIRFTLIFEYSLAGGSRAEVKAWAEQFHALGATPFGPRYNAALQRVTDQFTRHGAAPGRPNGSALDRMRTNEFIMHAPWQLREFTLTPAGLLARATVKQTPDLAVDQAALSAFINANAEAVKAQKFVLPETFQGQPLLGGKANVDSNNAAFFWPRMEIADNDARFFFSLNTCNGCHNGETGNEHNGAGRFRHVSSRDIGQEARLSGFLTGITIRDKGDPSVMRQFNELAARSRAMQEALNPPTWPVAEGNADMRVARSRQGRVH